MAIGKYSTAIDDSIWVYKDPRFSTVHTGPDLLLLQMISLHQTCHRRIAE